MDYTKYILSAYSYLGFSPRDNQVDIVNQIISGFMDEGYKNIILCAGTGSGKSVMGMVVGRVMGNLTDNTDKENYIKNCTITMNTNVLVDQYKRSFERLSEKDFFFRKGAVNYPCAFMAARLPHTWSEQITAEYCETSLCDSKSRKECKFAQDKEKQLRTKCLVTNYSYFMMSNLHRKASKNSIVNIFDEAHTINEVFASHCSFQITNKMISGIIKRFEMLNETYTETSFDSYIHIVDELKSIEESLKYVKIEDEFDFTGLKTDEEKSAHVIELQKKNIQYFHSILGLITPIIDEFKIYMKNIQSSKEFNKLDPSIKEDMIKYQKLMRTVRRIEGIVEQINLIQNDEELLFEIISDGDTYGLSASPVFIKDYWKKLNTADYNLFMSATITKDLVEKTISLDGETKFIYVPSTFPPENKIIVDYNSMPLNYTNMQKPETIKKILDSCEEIVTMNNDVNGIILTTTFNLASKIANHLRMKTDIKVFEHLQGEKVADVIEKFKNYNKPCVLISPSLWEGISLDDDLSRYQIVCKTPYGSLASKRNKYIQYKFPLIYQQQTLLTLIQGFGRSVRSKEDFCFTFCLDKTTFFELWKPYNIWKNDYVYK